MTVPVPQPVRAAAPERATVSHLVAVPARRMLHRSIMAQPSRDGYRGHP
jgi:hypothetical protein